MRLSGLSLTAVLLFASFTLAQHSSSSSSSGGSSSSGSSGGGSHSSSSGGSSYSGSTSGTSHSSAGGYSSSGGSGHNSGGSSHSGGGHSSAVSNASGLASRGKNEHGSSLVSSRNGMEGSGSKVVRPIHEPKSGVPQRAAVPEKRSFFSFLRHPFRKPPPKVAAQPALYLPKPICLKGRCAPVCPVGQVRSGGACTTPSIGMCVPGQIWNGIACGHDQCSRGEIWNGSACFSNTRFLDNCFGLRTSLDRQEKRAQAAESVRQSACANGPAQECSEATAAWQGEENMRQNLLVRYRQCQRQSMSMYSARYRLSPYDSTLWFDSLRFNADF